MREIPAVYVKGDIFKTIEWVHSHDYYEREKNPDKGLGVIFNKNAINFKQLTIKPNPSVILSGKVARFKPELQGILFEKGVKNLNTIDTIKYWNKTYTAPYNSWYYQNPLSEYYVKLEHDENKPVEDITLLAEGFTVMYDVSVKKTIGDVYTDCLVELKFNISDGFFSEDNDIIPMGGNTEEQLKDCFCNTSASNKVSVYIRWKDIINAPIPGLIMLNLFRYEMLDYGYYY